MLASKPRAMSSFSIRPTSVPSNPSAPFLFLYFSQLVGIPVIETTTGKELGKVHDFVAQATVPYPTVSGLEIRTPLGRRMYPWSAVRGLTADEVRLSPDPTDLAPVIDYSVRRDLIRQPGVEVSDTSIVRIWDVHFVYSEGKMVLAHAETGIRGVLRTIGLEKPVMALLGSMLTAALRERFATFRHLQILKTMPDGSVSVPRRVIEMAPEELASALRQLPRRLRRGVRKALPAETAAALRDLPRA